MTHALVFEPVLELTTNEATRWHGDLQVLQTELTHAQSLAQRGIGLGALEELMMSSLLLQLDVPALVLTPTVGGGRRSVAMRWTTSRSTCVSR